THTLHRNHPDHHHYQTTLTTLHTHHHQPTHHNKNNKRPRAQLPTSAFERSSYWLTSGKREAERSSSEHPLLGAPLDLADPEGRRFSGELEQGRPWFIEQHRLAGTAVLPGAAMLEWAVAAVRASVSTDGSANGSTEATSTATSTATGTGAGTGTDGTGTAEAARRDGLVLEGVTFAEFLHFGAGTPVKVQASVAPEGSGFRVRCFGRQEDPSGDGDGGGSPGAWTEHLTVALATPATEPARPARSVDLDTLRERMSTADPDELYERVGRVGVEYGTAFRGLSRLLRQGEDEVLGLVEVAEAERDSATYTLHPVVLDVCFQTVAAFTRGADVLRLPVGVDRVVVYGRLPSRVWCHARGRGFAASGDFSMDLDLLSDSGELLVAVEGLRFRTVSPAAVRGLTVSRPREYEIEWAPFTPPAAAPPTEAEAVAQADADVDADAVWLVVGGDPDGSGGWHGRLLCDGMPSDGAAMAVDPESESALEEFFGARLSDALETLRSGTGTGTGTSTGTGTAAGSRHRIAGLLLDAVASPEAADARRPDSGGASESPGPGTDDPEIEAVYRLAHHSLLLLKHFLRAHADARPRVVIRSAGAAPGAGGSAVLAQSVLTGAAKAVISDHPDLRCVQIDLDPGGPVPSAAETVERAALLPGAGHLAVRGGRWYEARLTERELSGGRPPVTVRPDGTYLITGGLGGLGLAAARWLARQGARSLVLTGRRAPAGAEVPPEVAALRASGVRVEIRRADVARREEVAELMAFARRELPPVRGVLHLAGVTDDAVLDKQDWPRIRRVLDPKVRGAWNVHRECRDAGEELDFFVLFSSMTSMTGAAGQSGYVLANTVLDAFAAHRRGLGLSGLSVGWGAWAEVGMAARSGALEGLAAAGVDAMPPRQAFEAFSRITAGAGAGAGSGAGSGPGAGSGSGAGSGPGAGSGSGAHVGLARMDWRRYAAVAARSVPYTLLASVLPGDGGAALGGGGRSRSVEELTELGSADPGRLRELVLTELLDAVALLLDLGERQREELRPVFAGTRLPMLGLDSLTTVRLRSRLMGDYAADVPADFLFGGGTALEIAEFVCRQITLRGVLASDEDIAEGSDDTEVLTL
ncbi:type I polyketide synthase, partial [Streptomyces sp. NPDC020141]|uniref:type I polyketide synthase n=1 Tax=Streptomyces sp. NPDC020141 TaxID=3365065 RepID=UPI0037AB79E7